MIKMFMWLCMTILYCSVSSYEYTNSTDFLSDISERVKQHVINYKKYTRDTHQNVCNLNSLYIKFSDIGYNWIHEPEGIQFTYCHGTCVIGSYDESSVIYGMIVINHLNNNRIPLCCSPKGRKEDITISYYRGRNINRQTIRNFMPTHCGCG
ncbi:TGF-beta-like protein [Finch poxvirus]|uniref:TGF-beta-like protein n=1 Tax=Condorpox virus TaxID=3049970 RepID=A0AAT9UPR7_9POXV|nr:TGF-beta-like protein [Finch poxvirus]UOX39047.1 TGF-beta-like protein [Finch poxvirus]